MKTNITTFLFIVIIIISLIFFQSCKGQTKTSNDSPKLTAEQLKSSILNKVNQLNNTYKTYQENIKNIGYTKVLDLQRIKNDVGFEETNQIIKKTDSLQKDFNFNNSKLLSEWQEFINKVPSNLLEKNKKDNVLKKLQQKINITNKNYKADSTALLIIKNIVSILSDDKCKYKIIDNNILFYDRNCLNNYQKLEVKLKWAIINAKTNTTTNRILNKTN